MHNTALDKVLQSYLVFTFDSAWPTLEQSHVGTGHLLEGVVVRPQGGSQEVVGRGRPSGPRLGARPQPPGGIGAGRGELVAPELVLAVGVHLPVVVVVVVMVVVVVVVVRHAVAEV